MESGDSHKRHKRRQKAQRSKTILCLLSFFVPFVAIRYIDGVAIHSLRWSGFFFLFVAVLSFGAPRPQKPPVELPDGEGKVILQRACTVCHGLDQVTKFKGYYGKDDWADVVRTMVGDGAKLRDGEVPALVDYLFKSFGKTSVPEEEGRKILEASCVSCHDLENVRKEQLSKEAWQELVTRMIGMGAKVEDSQIPVLVAYLVKNFGPPANDATPR
jgi:cytochrome c5